MKLLFTMSSKAQLKNTPNLHEFWNVLELQNLYQLTVLTQKYFGKSHSARTEHSHFTRTALTNPLSENKYQKRT